MPDTASAQKPANGLPARSLAALFTGALAIGFAPVLIRWSEAGPVTTAFWRLTLALPFLWTWHLLTRTGADQSSEGASVWVCLLLPGFFFAADQAIWYTAVNLTTAANASLLVNFAPVFVAPVAWVWLGERFNRLFVIGTLMALAGVWFLVGASRLAGGTHVQGDALAFTAAIFYAGYQLAVKRLRREHGVARIMAWSSLACSVTLLAIALLRGESIFAMGVRGWLVVLSLALVCHIGGQGLITFSLAQLPASFSSVTLLVQPVAAAAFAWALLNEALGPGRLMGGVLILCGIYLARRGSGIASTAARGS